MSPRNAQPQPERSFTVTVITDDVAAMSTWLADLPVQAVNLARAVAAPEQLAGGVVLLDARSRHLHLEAAHLMARAEMALVVIGPADDRDEGMRYLDLGALDYLSSQVPRSELLARLRAAARYADEVTDDWLFAGAVAVSLGRHEVRRDGQTIHLTPTEFALLEVLALRPGERVPHDDIIQRLWPERPPTARHLVRVYVRQLREKLEEHPSEPTIIRTASGGGYLLNAAVRSAHARESA